MKTITPPKGVKIKAGVEAPEDEGRELMDCDGNELEEEDLEIEMFEAEEEVTVRAEGGALSASVATNASPSISVSTSSDISTSRSSSTSIFTAGSTSTLTSSAQTSSGASLTCISEDMDPELKMDTEFVNKLKDFLDHTPTSPQFLPCFLRIKANYSKCRKALKKRLQSEYALRQKLLEVVDNKGDSEATSEGEEKTDSSDKKLQVDEEEEILVNKKKVVEEELVMKERDVNKKISLKLGFFFPVSPLFFCFSCSFRSVYLSVFLFLFLFCLP